MRDLYEHWGTDTAISMPEAPSSDVPVMVDFDGFGFTMNGIVHNASSADLEEMFTPHFAPDGYLGVQSHEPLEIQPDLDEMEDDWS